MNLKKLLMDLGNELVQNHGFDPATVPPCGERRNTNPIKEFTDWVNENPKAQQVLAAVGVEWPTAKDPHPKVEPQWIGCWVMASSPIGELMQWGKDGATVEPYTDYKVAWAQAKFLAGDEFKKDESSDYYPYILNIFSNGQVRLDEYGDDLKPTADAIAAKQRCLECEEELGSMHNPSCGKRVIGCPMVCEADCSPDTQ